MVPWNTDRDRVTVTGKPKKQECGIWDFMIYYVNKNYRSTIKSKNPNKDDYDC